MLIFGTLGIAITAIAVWSTIHGQNGFAEVVKLVQGEPAFVVVNTPRGEFGEPGGDRLGPPNPNILPDHPQVKPQATGSDEVRGNFI